MSPLRFLALVLGVSSLAAGQSTFRVSVASNGTQSGGGGGAHGLSISGNGRWVAFQSFSTDLVPGVLVQALHVYVRDIEGGTTELVTINSSGEPATTNQSTAVLSRNPAISADGRFVAFESVATNIEPVLPGHPVQIYVHDRMTRTTRLVTRSLVSGGGNDESRHPSISADGRFIAFVSRATDLTSDPPFPPFTWSVFVVDRESGLASRLVADTSGGPPGNQTQFTSMSADGRFVVFTSWANDLVSNDTFLGADVFVHDRFTGATSLVDVATGGAQADVGAAGCASISSDGRFVTFTSQSTNLAPLGGGTQRNAVYVRDLTNGVTLLVSADSSGRPSRGPCYKSKISGDGRFVAFESYAGDLVSNDTNGTTDIFVHDRVTAQTSRASVSTNNGQGNHISGTQPPFTSGNDDYPYSLAISFEGRRIAFPSLASNLVPFDTNEAGDAFVREQYSIVTRAVVPASGSEAGDDFVTIHGSGYSSNVSGNVVEFAGARATVITAASDRLGVRTPPGTGVVDVVVRSALREGRLAGGYAYVAPDVAARWGSVNVALGEREDVLLVNGVVGDRTTREIVVGVGERIQAVVVPPSTRSSSRFAAYAWTRLPNASTTRSLPLGIGSMLFAPPFLGGSPPAIWNNVGRPRSLGVATFPSRPAPSVLFRSSGAPAPITLTLQGLIEDDGSASPALGSAGSRFSVTNAIVLRVR